MKEDMKGKTTFMSSFLDFIPLFSYFKSSKRVNLQL